MKKTATILLFLFTLVQAGPAVASLFTGASSVFVMDEEKSEDKTETEKKEKKDFTFYTRIAGNRSRSTALAFHPGEHIGPYPCLEKPTPPPNPC